MDQIPYKLLIMWGGVIPDYGDAAETGNTAASKSSDQSMSMFDMVANLQQGKGI